jgi:hypothetical protein
MPAKSAATDTNTVRLIHLSLILGVLLFLAVALFVRTGPAAVTDPRLPLLLVVVGVPMLILAQVLSSRIAPRRTGEPSVVWWQANLTRAIVVWSLVEGAALLGIVGFWLTGNRLPLALTAAGIVLFVVSAPGRLAAD